MEQIIDFLRTDTYLIILTSAILILFVAFIIMIYKFIVINKKYNKFIKKLGNSDSIEEDLSKYMQRVDKVERINNEIINYAKNLDEDIKNCIHKVGLVRYNAFKDTGSDLSFTLALLNEKNDGIVLNGIYSREMSNIYAKAVENGTSKNTLSEEEKQAIDKAMKEIETVS